MAPPLQHCQAALIAWISPARTPDFCADSVPSRRETRYAIISITLVQNIRQANLALPMALLISSGLPSQATQICVHRVQSVWPMILTDSERSNARGPHPCRYLSPSY